MLLKYPVHNSKWGIIVQLLLNNKYIFFRIFSFVLLEYLFGFYIFILSVKIVVIWRLRLALATRLKPQAIDSFSILGFNSF